MTDSLVIFRIKSRFTGGPFYATDFTFKEIQGSWRSKLRHLIISGHDFASIYVWPNTCRRLLILKN
jgi:hypothetical protein